MGGLKKAPKKGQKNEKKFVLNKYESVTHVSIFNFQGLFRNIVFRYVALVTILDIFFQRLDFFPLNYYTKLLLSYKISRW